MRIDDWSDFFYFLQEYQVSLEIGAAGLKHLLQFTSICNCRAKMNI